MKTKVYVGDLLENVREDDLSEKFSKFGPLEDVWVSRNPPGFAFVIFHDYHDAEKAVTKLDGKNLCGSRVRVEISKKVSRTKEHHKEQRHPRRRHTSLPPSQVGSSTRFASPTRRRIETSTRRSPKTARRPSSSTHYRYNSVDEMSYVYMPPATHHSRLSPRLGVMDYYPTIETSQPSYPSYSSYPDYSYLDDRYFSRQFAPSYQNESDYRRASSTGYPSSSQPYYEPKPREYDAPPRQRSGRSSGMRGRSPLRDDSRRHLRSPRERKDEHHRGRMSRDDKRLESLDSRHHTKRHHRSRSNPRKPRSPRHH